MLYGYYKFTPNIRTSTFYYASTKDDYIDFIDNEITRDAFDEDNYRINNNTLRLPLSSSNAYTYFRSELTGLFYNVLEVIAYPNYYEYKLEIDYWGTYIYDVDFEKFTIKRSNANIYDLGYYDDNKFLSNGYTETRLTSLTSDLTMTESQAIVVAVLNLQTDANVTTGEKGSELVMVGCTLSDLRNVANTSLGATFIDKFTGIEIACSLLGGVYEGGVYAGLVPARKAAIIDAYVLPTNLISLDTSTTDRRMTLHSKSSLNALSPGSQVDFYMYHIAKQGKTAYAVFNTEADKSYYAGTRDNGILLRKKYNTMEIRYRSIFSTSAVNVVICNGNQELDITDNFKLNLTTNNATETAIERAQRAVKYGTQAITTILSTIGVLAATQNPVAAGITAISGVASTASSINNDLHNTNTAQASALVSGDASFTYYYDLTHKTTLRTPFILKTYSAFGNFSIIEHAKNYGLTYDNIEYYVNDLKDLSNYPLILDASLYFVQADALVKNVPQNAANYITAELANGISLFYI